MKKPKPSEPSHAKSPLDSFSAAEKRGRQEQLLHAVNNAAFVLLSIENEEDIHSSLRKGIKIIAKAVDVDRIHIWRNEFIDSTLHYVNYIHWRRDKIEWDTSAMSKHSYRESPEWEKKFLKNEFINGPVSRLPSQERNLLLPQDIKSILAIPLYLHKKFWGFFSFDDCRRERTFSDDEVEILRSAGLMIINALSRSNQTEQLRNAHAYSRLMLEATPLGCHIWDKNFQNVDCNDEAVRLFGLKDKDEYVARFLDLSPKYQPDGSLSSEAIIPNIKKTIKEGKYVFPWMHQKLDGTLIPVEVTLVRVPFENDFIVTGYTRDMREHNRMINEIQRRDNLISIGHRATLLLLSTMNEGTFRNSILEGLEILGHFLDTDRVYIWQNETRGGKLFYVKKYEWTNSTGLANNPAPIDSAFPYSGTPEWKKNFLQGKCINGPVASLHSKDRAFLNTFGIKSVLIIPIHILNEFWGFIGFDDCHAERSFPEEEVNILRSVGIMMVSSFRQNEQAKQLREAHNRTQVLLNAMPLAMKLWDKNLNIIDCNEENLRLFKLEDKNRFLKHFYDFSPKFQVDGQPSTNVTKLIKKAFRDGKVVTEWMHQASDGTPLPVEVTHVRVNFGGDDYVATYARDLREHKQMMGEIEQRDYLLNTVNQAATIILTTEEEKKFNESLLAGMKLMGLSVGADRVYIMENETINGERFFEYKYAWTNDLGSEETHIRVGSRFSYDMVPDWVMHLSEGRCLNGPLSAMPQTLQQFFNRIFVKSLLVIPVFIQDYFWGLVSFSDCIRERYFSDNEVNIMRSGALMMISAIRRNEMTRDIHDTASKLEAVITNYPGIIWSVGKNNVINLFNGRALKRLDLNPKNIEGRKLADVSEGSKFPGILAGIQSGLLEKPQDFYTEIDGKTYRVRTTLLYDDSGHAISVVGSIDDVTERTRLQAELKAALNQAQQANAAKSSFLANMSHEMRTPLNAIIGLSELTLDIEKLDLECLGNLEKINNAGLTLLSTVNDILDISKIEAGKLELVPVEYDIPSLLNDAITQSIMRIGEKPISFILNIHEDLPVCLYGDDLRIKQILNNLLSNAFKYTKEGTVELGIGCERDGDSVWVTIWVKDTGIGIKKDDMKNLFTDYGQVDLLTNRRIEGTGLGLTITKRVVELMDGEIRAESQYKKGSVFTARFRQGFVREGAIGPEMVSSLKSFNYTDQKRIRNFSRMRIKLPYARVLVVDDVITNLDVARGMMKPYGMKIDCLTGGQEAIDAIRDEKVRYNAIFMDHMMPGMDGIEAVKKIRQLNSDYAKNVPIVALTANAIVGNEDIFLQNGFQAFISKPIDIDRLDCVIREWVRDKDLEKSLEKVQVHGEQVLNGRTGKQRRVVTTRRSGIDRRSFGKKIPGIDMVKGVERFGGDEESFLQILHSYAVHTKPLLNILKNVRKENLHEYAITVHGIKSSSRSICADMIGMRAEALEKASKMGNFHYVTANNAVFVEAVENLINILDEIFDELPEDAPKQEKDRPDRELLARLKNACQSYEMDTVDEIMEVLEKHRYTQDGGLVAWLKKNVEQMNFKHIIERLSEEDHGRNQE